MVCQACQAEISQIWVFVRRIFVRRIPKLPKILCFGQLFGGYDEVEAILEAQRVSPAQQQAYLTPFG